MSRPVVQVSLPAQAVALEGSEQYLYIALLNGDLAVYGIENSIDPTLVLTHCLAGQPNDLLLCGENLLVADGQKGLAILKHSYPRFLFLPLLWR
ncbi:MAG: hypothetical protein J7M05_03575 [Anaerolineae bacterium]|nr:hypothetical protein [Anaerolineae bacterium]